MVMCSLFKEPRFLSDFACTPWAGPGSEDYRQTLITDENTYLESFSSKQGAAWAIDASSDYLWCEASVERIKSWSTRFPSKLICVLRDPLERMFSEYQHTVRDHLETGSFLSSIHAEEKRRREHWHPLFYHLRRSQYHRDIKRYREAFGDNLLILDSNDLRDDQTGLRRVEAFLGVPRSIQAPDAPAEPNASHVYRSKMLGRLMQNDRVIRIARTLVPKGFRKRIRSRAEKALHTTYQRSRADTEHAAALLAEEIRSCRRDPLIPTASWTC